jgi:hypothetical protein
MFSPSWLFASLVWGSIGVGFLVYGTRQKAFAPTCGGILMIVASYFASSALSMTIICAILAFVVYVLAKQGY